jgi:hypothetical protein
VLLRQVRRRLLRKVWRRLDVGLALRVRCRRRVLLRVLLLLVLVRRMLVLLVLLVLLDRLDRRLLVRLRVVLGVLLRRWCVLRRRWHHYGLQCCCVLLLLRRWRHCRLCWRRRRVHWLDSIGTKDHGIAHGRNRVVRGRARDAGWERGTVRRSGGCRFGRPPVAHCSKRAPDAGLLRRPIGLHR